MPNGETTEGLENQAPGEYTVTVNDANNCMAEGQANIYLAAPPTPGFSGDTEGCVPHAIVFSNETISDAPATYQWTFQGGSPTSSTNENPIVQYNTSGQFDITLAATNEFGDSTIFWNNVIIINQGPALNTSSTPDNGSGTGTATVNISGGTAPYDVEWVNGETTETISGLDAGFYRVVVTDANDCESEQTVTVLTDPDGIWEGQQVQASIYPNPSTGLFELEFPGTVELKEMIVFNSMGQKVFSKNNFIGKTHTFDLSNEGNGIYFIRLASDDFVWSRKVVVR